MCSWKYSSNWTADKHNWRSNWVVIHLFSLVQQIFFKHPFCAWLHARLLVFKGKRHMIFPWRIHYVGIIIKHCNNLKKLNKQVLTKSAWEAIQWFLCVLHASHTQISFKPDVTVYMGNFHKKITLPYLLTSLWTKNSTTHLHHAPFSDRAPQDIGCFPKQSYHTLKGWQVAKRRDFDKNVLLAF